MNTHNPFKTTPHRFLALRIGLFWIGYLLILFVMGFIKSHIPPAFSQLFWGISSSVLIVILTAAFVRHERRLFSDVGLNFTTTSTFRFALGLLLSFAVYALIVLLTSCLLGPIHFERAATVNPSTVLLTVVTTLTLACMEELGFRAYPLQTLAPTLGYWPAQLIVTVAFGLCHILFGYSWLAVLTGVIPCALLFGATAIATRGLAMPIGVHAGLNLAQWALGEKGQSGLWATTATDSARTRIATFSPLIVVSVMIAATVLTWLASRTKRVNN
jgi:membrane protease YdiL (CAAX protease family)